MGRAAIAMWWDISSGHRAEFEDWHTHEHFPERMGIPGFHRGSRWAAVDGGEGFFVLYELESHETLSSAGYLARLNAPTPWSMKMMPHHRHMVRSQCRVLESVGGALSRHALTVRLSPADEGAGRLRTYLRELARGLPSRPGVTAGHLLQHQAPRMEATTEQRIRGGPDPAADWIFIVCGYELARLQELVGTDLADAALEAAGARAGALHGMYQLSHSNTADDVD